jgi:hypothetical protein
VKAAGKAETHIAVVDDGINEDFFRTGPLVHNVEVTETCVVKMRQGYDRARMSHGTVCAGIIRKYAPSTALSSVKILGENFRGLPRQLNRAIDYCVEKKIRVIHLSLGTIAPADFPGIRETVNRAFRKGHVIVAAVNNKNIYTCPASLANVIGVQCDRGGEYAGGRLRPAVCSPIGVDFFCLANHALIDRLGQPFVTYESNSFAAPLVTARAASLLADNPALSFDQLKSALGKMAAGAAPVPAMEAVKGIDWAESVLVFAPAGESFRFKRKLACFKCTGVIRPKAIDAAGYCRAILKRLRQNDLKVKKADTVAIFFGKLPESAVLTEDLVKGLRDRGKNLIAIGGRGADPGIPGQAAPLAARFWHPGTVTGFYGGRALPPEYCDPPMIFIHGCSGASNAQYAVRLLGRFLADGYKAVCASDACPALLYGAEYIPREAVMNRGLYQICRDHDPDLLLFFTDRHGAGPGSEGLYRPDVTVLIDPPPGQEDGPGFPETETVVLTGGKRIASTSAGTEKRQFCHDTSAGMEECYRYILGLFERAGKTGNHP